jgi:uncharacterized membrane protein
MLGLISVAGYVLIFLAIVVFVGGSVATGVMLDSTGANVPPAAASGLFVGAGLIVILIVLAIGLLVAMALFYGIPLVMLAGQNAWPAAQDSIAACWINILPLLVFGLIYLVLVVVAIIPFMLGFLVLAPVTFGAVYASYRDVFEGEGPAISLRK